MTDLGAQIQSMQKQIDLLEAKLRLFENYDYLPKNAVVGKTYVARLFGCSEEAVVRKRCGTAGLKPVRLKPLGFVKSEVDRAHKEFTKTPTERAFEAERAANTRKRKLR